MVASVHSSFRMGEKRMTERMMAAMDNPLVDAIGHPTGRKILRREPYAVDVERLVEHAAETGTMLEINAQPGPARPERPARAAGGRGRRADRDRLRRAQPAPLPLIRYGVATARRGWLEPKHVANTRTWKQLQKLRKPARRR